MATKKVKTETAWITPHGKVTSWTYVISVEGQRFRIGTIRQSKSYSACIEELVTHYGSGQLISSWSPIENQLITEKSAKQAERKSLHLLAERELVRHNQIGDFATLIPSIFYSSEGYIDWCDRDEAILVAEQIGYDQSLIEYLDARWHNINKSITDGEIQFFLAGTSGPRYLLADEGQVLPVLRQDTEGPGFIGPPAPSIPETSEPSNPSEPEFNWPEEKPKFWPKGWPYPPPEGWSPPTLKPPYNGPVFTIPPDTPDWWLGHSREGVRIEYHWYGNCYYCESEVVDDVIDALNESAAGGAGSSILLAFLKKWPFFAFLLGSFSGASWWMAAHIGRVRRGQVCRPPKTKGIVFCLYFGVTRVYPWCY